MKSRKAQYALWLIGTLVLSGGAFALTLMQVLPVRGGFAIAVFWLWNGFCLMMNWHPEYRQWDCWEKQVYGLAFAVMGGMLVALSFTAVPNLWMCLFLTFAPTGLIALIGRYWYVEKKRNEDYLKKQTEKD